MKNKKIVNLLIRHGRKLLQEEKKKDDEFKDKELWELGDPNQDDAVIEKQELYMDMVEEQGYKWGELRGS